MVPWARQAPACTANPELAGELGDLDGEPRLADPGLTGDPERLSLAQPGTAQQPPGGAQLRPAADQRYDGI